MNWDPLGEAGGINLYGFVSNDPVNFVDPWGLWQGTAEIGASPSGLEAVRDSVSIAVYNIVNDPHPGARADTVMNIAGTITMAGAIGSAGMVKYGATALPHLANIAGGTMPYLPPEGYGMYVALGIAGYKWGQELWDWLEGQWENNCP